MTKKKLVSNAYQLPNTAIPQLIFATMELDDGMGDMDIGLGDQDLDQPEGFGFGGDVDALDIQLGSSK